jgi:hypothetical protein
MVLSFFAAGRLRRRRKTVGNVGAVSNTARDWFIKTHTVWKPYLRYNNHQAMVNKKLALAVPGFN